MNTHLLRWSFKREDQCLTCQVTAAPNRDAYAVLTLPHWNSRGAIVEAFGTLSQALQRHAAIATELRDSGWCVAEYTV